MDDDLDALLDDVADEIAKTGVSGGRTALETALYHLKEGVVKAGVVGEGSEAFEGLPQEAVDAMTRLYAEELKRDLAKRLEGDPGFRKEAEAGKYPSAKKLVEASK